MHNRFIMEGRGNKEGSLWQKALSATPWAHESGMPICVAQGWGGVSPRSSIKTVFIPIKVWAKLGWCTGSEKGGAGSRAWLNPLFGRSLSPKRGMRASVCVCSLITSMAWSEVGDAQLRKKANSLTPHLICRSNKQPPPQSMAPKLLQRTFVCAQFALPEVHWSTPMKLVNLGDHLHMVICCKSSRIRVSLIGRH